MNGYDRFFTEICEKYYKMLLYKRFIKKISINDGVTYYIALREYK